MRRALLVMMLLASAAAARADWKAVEQVKTYGITGSTGPELYASIGDRGPTVGGTVLAIAHTSFKLTWSRKYEPQGTSCVLVSARPKLIITYMLPKPADDLSAAMVKNWQAFIDGLSSHEKIHGDMIRDMVGQIETATVGMSVANDPDCRLIRAELKTRLARLSQMQRQKSRDFDRVELSPGGNIHQIVLRLVNGG